jgi:hypothetical protein
VYVEELDVDGLATPKMEAWAKQPIVHVLKQERQKDVEPAELVQEMAATDGRIAALQAEHQQVQTEIETAATIVVLEAFQAGELNIEAAAGNEMAIKFITRLPPSRGMLEPPLQVDVRDPIALRAAVDGALSTIRDAPLQYIILAGLPQQGQGLYSMTVDAFKNQPMQNTPVRILSFAEKPPPLNMFLHLFQPLTGDMPTCPVYLQAEQTGNAGPHTLQVLPVLYHSFSEKLNLQAEMPVVNWLF